MDSKLVSLHHRSKERIKDFGEVFTPENYVNQMLDLLDDKTKKESIWSDESTIFFEPTCGHGNFVEAVFTRRAEALYKKALKEKNSSPHFYAVANAMNTLWAIDLDKANVEFCRSRILLAAVRFINSYEQAKSIETLIKKNQTFFAHLLCAIRWQIHENEALSALSDDINAKKNAEKTKSGSEWLQNNKHKPIDFEFTWCEFYAVSLVAKTTPVEFVRATKFLQAGGSSQYKDFEFAKVISGNRQLDQNTLMAG